MSRTLAFRGFNFVIGLIFLAGLFSSALIAKYTAAYFASWGAFVLLLVYVAIAFVGVTLSKDSNDPLMLFIGFMLVMAPSGLVLNRFLSTLRLTVVYHVTSIAIATVAVMAIAALVLPKLFRDPKHIMCIAAVSVIVFEIISQSAGWSRMGFFSMLITGGYCLYVAYIWGLAGRYEFTTEAAMDGAVEFYLKPIWRVREFIASCRDDFY